MLFSNKIGETNVNLAKGCFQITLPDISKPYDKGEVHSEHEILDTNPSKQRQQIINNNNNIIY